MSTIADLMGVGMPGPQASRLGNTPATQAGVGTATATAAVIQTTATIATTSGGATAFRLPDASLGRPFYFYNSTATTALVFPTTGGNFNNGSTDASFSVVQNKQVIFIRLSSTLWASNLTA